MMHTQYRGKGSGAGSVNGDRQPELRILLGGIKMITLCLLLSLFFKSGCTRDSYEDLLKYTHICISSRPIKPISGGAMQAWNENSPEFICM